MGTVLIKMGLFPILVTLSAAAAFTLLPGGLDGEEDAIARTREKREAYDYYAYDDEVVPPSSTDEVLTLDENGYVPCQSKDQCPADFTQVHPTTTVTYSCDQGFCREEVEEDHGIAGGKEVNWGPLNVEPSFINIGNPNSGGVCHQITCKSNGKCSLLVSVGQGGKSLGCPPDC